ncbi:phage regulatory CII family protein [Stenotrophomonas sp. HITSZ_GD]|uniref:phage regulatory CII family protein n=1 Tax=Stenotrophomonas sp. HITSZ_GD TaxID=3037248 RepID=UPI00240DF282|nr:phage regulatory CII family protein [Stenotrophomonas sp. HITSZ_GD]MDG2524621.1 phage regulatory CII family protein [Stenotrophomonas sp. HITSZ_GD]
MNILDAAHKTVKNYPGGSESLAPRIGMSAAVLRNKVNPNNDTHHLTLVEASEIMGVTSDDRILHALAAEHGYTLQPISTSAHDTVMGAVLANASQQGAFAQALRDALSDGLITENEMNSLSAAGTAQMEAMVHLLSRLRAVTGRPGVEA